MVRIVAVVVILPVFLTAGCFVDDSIGITIGEPQAGEEFVYTGSDGSSVTIKVLGQAVRSDGLQQRHEVVLLEYRFRFVNYTNLEFPVVEAINISTGMHVRHDVLCELEGPPEDLSCDPSYQEVFFGAAGLGGGLGMAPWWGGKVPSGGTSLAVTSPTSADDVRITARPVPDEPGCYDVSADAGHLWPWGAWMPMTSFFQPKMICDGEPLPREWVPDRAMPRIYSSVDFPVFTLAEVRPATAGAPDPSDEPLGPILREQAEGPLSVVIGSDPFGGFTGIQAHEIALDKDAGYRSFFREEADAAMVRADFTSGGGASTITSLEAHSYWTITLGRPDGSTYLAKIRRNDQTDLLHGSGTTYDVIEAGPGKRQPFPAGLPDNEHFDAGLSYRYGSALFGFPADLASHKFLAREQVGGVRVPLDDRFVTRTFYVPPDQKGQCSGTCVATPWIVEAESAGGWITYVRLPPDLRLSA